MRNENEKSSHSLLNMKSHEKFFQISIPRSQCIKTKKQVEENQATLTTEPQNLICHW